MPGTSLKLKNGLSNGQDAIYEEEVIESDLMNNDLDSFDKLEEILEKYKISE
jgi:hypothetical protein